jgi:uncharacterized protein
VTAAALGYPGRGTRSTNGDGMAGRFELYKDAAGRYRFRLKASNGETIAFGAAYDSKAGALNGIQSVRQHALHASIEDQTG